MVVVGEIGRRVVVEGARKGEGKEAVPLETRELGGSRPGVRFVVILHVARVHEEVGAEAVHRVVDAVAAGGIVAARVVAAGHDGEFHRCNGPGRRGGAESALDRGASPALRVARFDPYAVGGSRLQAGERDLTRVIPLRIHRAPGALDGRPTRLRYNHHPGGAGGAGQRTLHFGQSPARRQLAAGIRLEDGLAQLRLAHRHPLLPGGCLRFGQRITPAGCARDCRGRLQAREIAARQRRWPPVRSGPVGLGRGCEPGPNHGRIGGNLADLDAVALVDRGGGEEG